MGSQPVIWYQKTKIITEPSIVSRHYKYFRCLTFFPYSWWILEYLEYLGNMCSWDSFCNSFSGQNLWSSIAQQKQYLPPIVSCSWNRVLPRLCFNGTKMQYNSNINNNNNATIHVFQFARGQNPPWILLNQRHNMETTQTIKLAGSIAMTLMIHF